MCGSAPKPPEPKAPPPPATKASEMLDANANKQKQAAAAAKGGYEASLLSGAGGDQSKASVTSPILGG